jgi:hypothetical protein
LIILLENLCGRPALGQQTNHKLNRQTRSAHDRLAP